MAYSPNSALSRDFAKATSCLGVLAVFFSKACRTYTASASWVMEAYGLDFMKHFERKTEICGGETVITGSRVTLRTVLASLADGDTVEVILKDFPSLLEEDVRAAIAFASPPSRR
jgi:uncharacterized protein (DUF433 family)